MSENTSPKSSPSLLRSLGYKESLAVVVGTVIGTGVFLKTAPMSQAAGGPGWVLLAWLVAGVMSLAGAFSYAELGAAYPQAGGEYVYLREGYGSFVGFLYGWSRFWIGSPGSVAAYGVGAATFLGVFLPSGGWLTKNMIAVSLIAFFSLLNCASVAFGGRLQSAITALKVAMIVGLAISIFMFAHPFGLSALTGEGLGFDSQHWRGFSAFGAAVLSALWAFDGWNNLTMVGGEIINPKKNLPRSLAVGMFIVFGIYILANLAYFYALPFGEVVTSNSNHYPDALPVAAKAAQAVFGSLASMLLSVAFVFSAMGAMNGSILSGARAHYALARDGLFFAPLARVSESTRVPYVAVLAQGAWACVLAISGTFDQLTDCVIFASWIFYALNTASIFARRRKLRRAADLAAKELDAVAGEPEFQVPGYPFVPAAFLVCASLLLVNTLYTAPRESLFGLALIALGVPFYFWFQQRRVV